jgi:two-component system chemotaxis response regulator CheY
MRILIVEDDFGSRRILQRILSTYGECDVAINGVEAVEAYMAAFTEDAPYDLICLDIMMPEMDGREALIKIREYEEDNGIVGLQKTKIIMTTALDDPKSIVGSFKDQCEAYLVKPITSDDLIKKLKSLELIK